MILPAGCNEFIGGFSSFVFFNAVAIDIDVVSRWKD
jgi:hypothetical protein